jgi:hypothetical protein
MEISSSHRPRAFTQGMRASRWDNARYCRAIFPHTGMETTAKNKKVPAKAEATASQEEKRAPIKVFRVEDCSASVWQREHAVQGKPMKFYSVTLERSYKDRDGEWKYTKSFDADALGKVVTLCQQASEYIRDLQQQDAA